MPKQLNGPRSGGNGISWEEVYVPPKQHKCWPEGYNESLRIGTIRRCECGKYLILRPNLLWGAVKWFDFAARKRILAWERSRSATWVGPNG
jgi:hypothetical protein